MLTNWQNYDLLVISDKVYTLSIADQMVDI